ncbi:MAG: putative sugar O-methyltransferase, partial [Thalassobaculaceae bacterium]
DDAARRLELATAASDRAEDDWFAAKAHTHERHKFTLFPSIEVLAKFRDHQIGGIGLEPQDFMLTDKNFGLFEEIKIPTFQKGEIEADLLSSFLKSVEILESLRKALEIEHFSQEFFDVFFGNLVEVHHNGGLFGTIKVLQREVLTSFFAIRTAHRSAIATELHARETAAPPRAVLELGGGFGKSLADLVRIFPAATALYVDLPVNMAVAAHYFDGRFPGRVNLVWRDTDAVRAGMVNVVAPWLIDKFDPPIDLMINFLSMHHMPQRTMDFYFARLIAPKVRFFYHENRLVPRNAEEGEGLLEKTPERAKMEMCHSVQIPWGNPKLKTFSEFMRNPALTEGGVDRSTMNGGREARQPPAGATGAGSKPSACR